MIYEKNTFFWTVKHEYYDEFKPNKQYGDVAQFLIGFWPTSQSREKTVKKLTVFTFCKEVGNLNDLVTKYIYMGRVDGSCSLSIWK